MPPIGEADTFEGAPRHPATTEPAPACVDEGEFDVALRGLTGEEFEGLKNEPDALIAHLGEFGGVHAADIAVAEHVAAGGWAVETAEDIHQRALARA